MAAQRTSGAKGKKSGSKRGAAVVNRPRKAAPEARARVKPAKGRAREGKAQPVVAGKGATKVVVKPVKVSSGLSKSDLGHFRELLLERRREILGDVGSMESEAFKAGSNLSNMPIHMADVGTDNFEQEFTLGLIESERQILREIQEALMRVENGTYGICQGTNKPIPKVRLEAVPWAKYTAEYASALEQGLVRRDAGSPRDEEAGDEDEE